FRSRQALDVVQRRVRADSDVSVAPDARISAALRAADVSLLGLERAAMAGLVLLAGRVLAALGAIWRRAHEPRHDARAHPRHQERGEDAGNGAARDRKSTRLN